MLPRPYRLVLPVKGRLRQFVDYWSGITQDPFVLDMVQGHLFHFNQKPLLVKPSHKYEVNYQNPEGHNILRE